MSQSIGEWVEVEPKEGSEIQQCYYWERRSNRTCWEKPDAQIRWRQSTTKSGVCFHCFVSGKQFDALPPVSLKNKVHGKRAEDDLEPLQPKKSSSALDWLDGASKEKESQKASQEKESEIEDDAEAESPQKVSPKQTGLAGPFAASGEEDEWARRIKLLIDEEQFGMHLNQVNWKWEEKWPDDPIENFKPCTKLKSAFRYVKDLTIVNDKIFLVRPASANTLKRIREPGQMSAALSMAQQIAAMPLPERKEIRSKFDGSSWEGWETALEYVEIQQNTGLYYCSIKLKWPQSILDSSSLVGAWTYASETNGPQEFCILSRGSRLVFEEVRGSLKVKGEVNDSDAGGWKQFSLLDDKGKQAGYANVVAISVGMLEVSVVQYGQDQWMPSSKAHRKSHSAFHGYGEGPIQAATGAFQQALLQEPSWLKLAKPKSAVGGSSGHESSQVISPRTAAAHRRMKVLDDVIQDLAQANLRSRKLFDPRGETVKMVGKNASKKIPVEPLMRASVDHNALFNGEEHQAILKRMDESTHALCTGVVRLLVGDLAIDEPPLRLNDLEGASFLRIVSFAWMYALALPGQKRMRSVNELRAALQKAHSRWLSEAPSPEPADEFQVGSWEGILPPDKEADPGIPPFIWDDLLEKSLRTRGEIQLAEDAIGMLSTTWPPRSYHYTSHWLQLLYLERCADLQHGLADLPEALLHSKVVYTCEWSTDKMHRADFDLRLEPPFPPHLRFYLRRGDLLLVTPHPPKAGECLIAEARADLDRDCDLKDKKEGSNIEEKALVIKLKMFSIALPVERIAKAYASSKFVCEPIGAFSRVTHDRQVEALKAATKESGTKHYCEPIRRMIVDSWKLDGPGDEKDPSSPQALAAECPEDFKSPSQDLPVRLVASDDVIISPNRKNKTSVRIDEASTSAYAVSPAGIPLTRAQQKATLFSLSRRCTLIRGPPGTGKTHTACAIIDAWRGLSTPQCEVRVLVVTQSNVAAFNIQERMSQFGLASVRVGMGMLPSELLDQSFFCQLFEPHELKQLREAEGSAAASPRVMQPLLQKATRKAHVVVMTCISSGNANLLNGCRFHRVLFDESAQATEPTALVPLMSGASCFACVGDDRQLPATILSMRAKSFGLDHSLFERLLRHQVVQENKGFVQLDVQRRMHSSISEFPSHQFYGGRVMDGIDDQDRPPIRGFWWPRENTLRVCFVDCQQGEQQVGTSFRNYEEAMMLVMTLMSILDTPDRNIDPSNIAAITGYSAQKDAIQRLIPRYAPRDHPARRIRIDTVDAFQGMERDLVLVSTVRCNDSGDVGFLRDKRRTNVLLTRARRGLIVFGDGNTLSREHNVWLPWLRWVGSKHAVVQQNDIGYYLIQ